MLSNFSVKPNLSNRSLLVKLFHLKRFVKKLLPLIIFSLLFYFVNSNIFEEMCNKTANKFYYHTKEFGFRLENIYLEGHFRTSQLEVIKKMGLQENESLLKIDLPELKRKLEELPWVKYASIDRQYPHTLMIHLLEKQPMAVLRKNGKYYLVDENGQVIKERSDEEISNLPVLVGQDSPLKFLELLPIISKDKELYDNIILANWIGNRRWNIVFMNKIKVKLPEENIAKAWEYVIKLYYENKLSNMELNYIDLRIDNKIYLR